MRVDGRRVGSVLLVGETSTLFGNACVDDTIAAYLADGTLPVRRPGDGPDAFCEPTPQPVPGVAALTSAHHRTPQFTRR